MMEPVYVNPCSYEAVAAVLRNIGQKVGVSMYGGNREWVAIVCDGVPFNLCRRLLASTYLCPVCQASLEGVAACRQHAQNDHPTDQVNFLKEFGCVLLQPGLGHIEMNMVKGLVELSWDVFWKELAICMNFRSEAALNCAKKVSDHHKGWTFCQIARHSVTQELLIPFTRQELLSDQPQLSTSAFLKFVIASSDPNYAFMCDIIFKLLDAVFMFRAGVRSNIPQFIRAGRAKYAKVWPGRHHPLYCELEMSDTICLSRMPQEIHSLIEASASINLSDHPNHGQGADVRLEELNKQVHEPSTSDWRITCSNFDQLNMLHNTIFEQMDIKDPKRQESKYIQKIDEEIAAFRKVLRKKEYLLHPEENREHVSLNGSPLDVDLKNFCSLAREQRANYFDAYMFYERNASNNKPRPPTFKTKPVFVTEDERKQYTSIENRTISELKEMTAQNIEMLSDIDVREVMISMWADLLKPANKPTKSKILDFLYEVQVYLNDQEQQPQQDSSDDEV